nr:transketolase [Planctomycetota bacterium]
FSEDVLKRYEAYGWHVQAVPGDGNDMEAFEKALENAKSESGRPSIIKLRTHIGFGSPTLQDSEKAHGSPLGDDEIKLIKKNYGWDPEKKFFVPEQALEHMRKCVETGKQAQQDWQNIFDKYAGQFADLAEQISQAQAGKLPVDIDAVLPEFDPKTTMATRKASGNVLNAVMPKLPLFMGGSADLTPSNNTWFEGAESFSKDNYLGRYIHYGVREHAMGSIMNGISVSGLTRAYGATFLVFSDYMRPAIRVAALSKYPSVFVFTHDSIGVGEDGPTHQPVEHYAALRAIPNLLVFRPADANETAQTWKYCIENKVPATMFLTRQNLPVLDQDKYGSAKNVEKGAYVLIEEENPDCLLLATGSELQLAVNAHEKLAAEGIKAQVVSMPCWELFEQQPQEYKDSVLPPAVSARVGIEAGIDNGWYKWLGTKGEFVGMNSFGASAPAPLCFEKFGITTENVVAAAKNAMK